MATFSPTDAAFEGFRLTREKPAAISTWAIVYLVVTLVMGVVLIGPFGEGLRQMEALESGADPAEAWALLVKLAPLYAVLVPAGLVLLAVYSAAVYRAVLRPSETGLGYLKLGRDELRLALLMLIYVLLAIGFTFAVTLAAGLLAGFVSVVAKPVIGIVGVLIGLAAMALFAVVAVRLSLAGPMTFAEQRLRVFESWRLTKGHFWRLLGAYVLATILALVVVLLGMIIYAATAAVLTGGDLAAVGAVFEPDTSSFASYFTPAMLVYIVFAAFLAGIQNAVMYAPAAVAYRSLSAGD